MRSIYLILLSLSILFLNSCESENEQRRDNNSFLPDNTVDITLELSRPTNANLRFNGGELFLSRDRALGSFEGIYVFRASSTVFFAYELAEPNHPLGSCSIEIDEDRGVPQVNSEGRFEYDCDGQTTLYDSLSGQQIGNSGGFGLRAYTVFPQTNGEQVTSIRITR